MWPVCVSVCVCVCARARARACACVRVRIHISQNFKDFCYPIVFVEVSVTFRIMLIHLNYGVDNSSKNQH